MPFEYAIDVIAKRRAMIRKTIGGGMAFVWFVLLMGLGFLFWRKINTVIDLEQEVKSRDDRLNDIKDELELLANNDIGLAKDLLERFHEEMNYFGYIHGGMKDREPRTPQIFIEEMVSKYRL
jgi:hypothetical protein